MIVRPFTFLTGLLFALSGAYLFVVKHQSHSLEDQMQHSAAAIRRDEEAIRVLKAQWALEADPSRIAALAAQFTRLQPMKPGQLVTLASLAQRLPPPGSSAPFGNPQDEVPGQSGQDSATPSQLGPPINVQGNAASGATADLVPPETHRQQSADNAAPVDASFNLPKPPPEVRPQQSADNAAPVDASFSLPKPPPEVRPQQSADNAAPVDASFNLPKPPPEVRPQQSADNAAPVDASFNLPKPPPEVRPQQSTDNAEPVDASYSLPKPPPARPQLPGAGEHGRRVSFQAVHEKQASRPRLELPRSAIYESSARVSVSAPPPSRSERRGPLGAQIVRIRATAQSAPVAPPATPLGGGSLLGMAQDGSQN